MSLTPHAVGSTPVIAYLANEFPSHVEPYVTNEIAELRRRGLHVVTGSVRQSTTKGTPADVVVLRNVCGLDALRALLLCLWHWRCIADLLKRVLLEGDERWMQRAKALVHTWLGAVYAIRLQKYRINHIHVHHGYFGAWVALVAARFLRVDYSLTLHGSDLLVRGCYLDVKLQNCALCFTVSDYNRRYIFEHYPEISENKVCAIHLGVLIPDVPPLAHNDDDRNVSRQIRLLCVGRLHRVKDHDFLVRACAELRRLGIPVHCSIAGDGPERQNLQRLIGSLALEDCVTLLGHIKHDALYELYDRADLVVLTSRSEGIPLVLMEAMARGAIVLAPAITGIPELVIPRETGFLYQPGSQEDFMQQVRTIRSVLRRAEENTAGLEAEEIRRLRRNAIAHVRENFSLTENLQSFGDLFLHLLHSRSSHAGSVLQQVQLSL